jgi:hypothetical protein
MAKTKEPLPTQNTTQNAQTEANEQHKLGPQSHAILHIDVGDNGDGVDNRKVSDTAAARRPTSTTEGRFHPPLGPEPNAFRILRLHPAYDYNAPVRCQLLHANLDDRPSFKAVS